MSHVQLDMAAWPIRLDAEVASAAPTAVWIYAPTDPGRAVLVSCLSGREGGACRTAEVPEWDPDKAPEFSAAPLFVSPPFCTSVGWMQAVANTVTDRLGFFHLDLDRGVRSVVLPEAPVHFLSAFGSGRVLAVRLLQQSELVLYEEGGMGDESCA